MEETQVLSAIKDSWFDTAVARIQGLRVLEAEDFNGNSLINKWYTERPASVSNAHLFLLGHIADHLWLEIHEVSKAAYYSASILD